MPVNNFLVIKNRTRSICLRGTWRSVVLDLLEGVVEASQKEQEYVCLCAWVGEGVSVNSPPGIKNCHAGAMLCAALTSPTNPLLTFPCGAGGYESQCRLYPGQIWTSLTGKALPLVTPVPPLVATLCQNTTTCSMEGLHCSACC